MSKQAQSDKRSPDNDSGSSEQRDFRGALKHVGPPLQATDDAGHPGGCAGTVLSPPAPATFPPEMVAWVEKLRLQPTRQYNLLVELTGDAIGATAPGELADLDSKDLDEIKQEFLPKAKRAAFQREVDQLKSAAGRQDRQVTVVPGDALSAGGKTQDAAEELRIEKAEESSDGLYVNMAEEDFAPPKASALHADAQIKMAEALKMVEEAQLAADAAASAAEAEAKAGDDPVESRRAVALAHELQVRAASMNQAPPEGRLHHGPFGAILSNGPDQELMESCVSEAETRLKAIKELLDRQRHGDAEHAEQDAETENAKKEMLALMKMFDKKLSVEQQQLVWAHLCKKRHLHDAIVLVDKKQLDVHAKEDRCKGLIRRLMSQNNIASLAARATATSAIAMTTQYLMEGFQGFNFISVGDAAGAGIAFIALTAIELGRWAYDPHYTREALTINIGEHAVGATASGLGAWGGFVAGSAAGSVGGPACALVGAILGMLVGSVGLDFATRKCYRYLITDKKIKHEEQAQQEAKQEFIKEQFKALRIDKVLDDFPTAQRKFRQLMLLNHPDKVAQRRHEFKTEDDFMAAFQRAHATSQGLLCAWVIVRKEYEKRDPSVYTEARKAADQSGFYSEGCLKLIVKKFKKDANDCWQTVQTWWSDSSDDPVLGERRTDDGFELVQMEQIFI